MNVGESTMKVTEEKVKIYEFTLRGDEYKITKLGNKILEMVWRGDTVPDRNIHSHSKAISLTLKE